MYINKSVYIFLHAYIYIIYIDYFISKYISIEPINRKNSG